MDAANASSFTPSGESSSATTCESPAAGSIDRESTVRPGTPAKAFAAKTHPELADFRPPVAHQGLTVEDASQCSG